MSIINKTNLKAFINIFKSGQFSLLTHRVLTNINDTIHYPRWFSTHQASQESLKKQTITKFNYSPLISIVVPTYNTPFKFLNEMISSVQSQSYNNWELCIADASTNNTGIRSVLKDYAKKDTRIKVRFLENNLGISENTNEALSIATGEFIGLLDHDDILEPNTLYEIVSALNHDNSIDILYTDEDKMDSNYTHYYPNFKPDYNRYLLRSCNYICHFFVFKRSIYQEIGGFDHHFDGSQDYDFILRATSVAKRIYHIPLILYHWRVHSGSTAGDPNQKMYCYDSAKRALEQDLTKQGINGVVKHAPVLGFYNTLLLPSGNNTLLLLTLDKNFKMPVTINSVTIQHHFCPSIEDIYSQLKNTQADFVAILNKGITTVPCNFFEQTCAHLQNSEIGALTYKIIHKNKILSMGLTYHNEHLTNCYYKTHKKDVGYLGRAALDQFVPLCSGYAAAFRANDMKSFLNNIIPDLELSEIFELFILFSSYTKRERDQYTACLAQLSLDCDNNISCKKLEQSTILSIQKEELKKTSALFAIPPYLY